MSVEVLGSVYSFAALKDDGSVVTWGNNESGGDSSAVADALSSGVINIYSNEGAFAAVKDDGSVVTWGDTTYGGDSSAVSAELANGVNEIIATQSSFAALKDNGSVVTWPDTAGDSNYITATDKLTGGVISIFSTSNAFAAIKEDGSVVTWGDSSNGGDSSAVSDEISSEVTTIVANANSFAALKADGSVIAWGDPSNGGDITNTGIQVDDVITIASPFTERAMSYQATATASTTTTEDSNQITGQLTATDVDGDALTYSLLGTPIDGLNIKADGTWTFDPSNSAYQSLGADDTQAITVHYGVSDSNGGSSQSSFVINLSGTNDAPTATFATAQATSEGSAEITGQLTATDVDAGDTLTYSLNNAVLKDATGNVIKDADDNPIAVAGLEINDDGSWSFDPSNDAYNALAKGQTQTITVDYTVTDGSDATGNGSFVISLTGTNDAPVATFSAAQTTTEDAAAPISGQLTATDVDSNDTLTYQLLGAPIDGLTINSTTGAWSFDPSNAAYQSLGANDSQTINVAYSVTDTNGAISQNSFNITLSGTNDKPVANAAALVLPSIQEDTTLNFSEAQLLSGVSDVDGDKLSVVANSIQITTGDASVAINPAGGWTITPDANYQGEVSFSYSISDGTLVMKSPQQQPSRSLPSMTRRFMASPLP